jgi:hypothetical protein
MNTQQLENNVIESFKLAKQDIVKLYQNVGYLLGQVEQLKKENAYLITKVESISKKKRTVIVKTAKKVAKKTVTKRASKKFLATKGGNKVHDTHCPFAKNIKPKNKVVFASKVKALNEGYKFCKCLA